MSDATTKQMIDMYMETAPVPMFLSGLFRTPGENFFTSEKVEVDVERDEEEIAIVVHDLTAGWRENQSTKYENKEFTPPVFKEEGTVSAFEMIKRRPGVDPFKQPDFLAHASEDAFKIFRKLQSKIARSVELMASQVLQTGTLTLTDVNAVALYTLDFGMLSDHKMDVTEWATGGSGGSPLVDLALAAQRIRRNGKVNPNKLLFGDSAFQRFLANADVQKRIVKDGLGIGQLAPASRGEGATFQGWIWIGHYRFEMWLYDGYYKAPSTGTLTPYIGTDNVIMLSDKSRLDLKYGAIPLFDNTRRALPVLPQRMNSVEKGIGFTVNSWVTPDGEHLKVQAGTRPITIPTAIDTFVTLDVGA